MNSSIQTFIEMCQWDPARFLIFSDNVFGPLIYYSHFFALILSIIIGIFLLSFMFSLWVIFDLILWATDKPQYSMFFWSTMILVESLVYALCVYFVDIFINKKD